jgi:hypothetical protein
VFQYGGETFAAVANENDGTINTTPSGLWKWNKALKVFQAMDYVPTNKYQSVVCLNRVTD